MKQLRKDLPHNPIEIPGAPDWVGSVGGLGPSSGNRWAEHKYEHRACWTTDRATLVVTGPAHDTRAPLTVVRWVLEDMATRG